jgi:hypothetical protein
LLVILFARRRGKQWCFVLFFLLFVVFYFPPDEVEDLWLSAQEEGVAEDVFAGVFAALMEAVHVELADEGVDVAVPEVFGEDVVLEVIDLLDGKLAPVRHPVDDRLVVLVLQDFEALLDEIGNRCVNKIA